MCFMFLFTLTTDMGKRLCSENVFFFIFLLFIQLRTSQANYEKLTTDNLVQHGFQSSINIYLTHDINVISLPRGCNGTQIFRFGP